MQKPIKIDAPKWYSLLDTLNMSPESTIDQVISKVEARLEELREYNYDAWEREMLQSEHK